MSAKDLGFLQSKGVILAPVTVCSISSAISGNTKYTFQSAVGGINELPNHRFKVGEVAKAESLSKDDFQLQGVVVKITDSDITILVKDEVSVNVIPDRLKLYKLANTVSYKRMVNAMNGLTKIANEPTDLVKVLFNQKEPTFKSDLEFEIFHDEKLNESQKKAVRHCLSANQIALIHGPPGTGKTQTCVEVIKQFVQRGKKVLVCGPSNISVDNLVERLGHSKLDIVRLGHPARILDNVLLHSLEYRLQFSDGGEIVNDVQKELNSNLSALGKCRRKSDRRVIYQELKALRAEVENIKID